MLRDTVCRLLREDWSPEQIPGRLRKSQLVGESKMYVSHETIYKSLFIQEKGEFREGLKKHLRAKKCFGMQECAGYRLEGKLLTRSQFGSVRLRLKIVRSRILGG
jgi:IS30 family transposase